MPRRLRQESAEEIPEFLQQMLSGFIDHIRVSNTLDYEKDQPVMSFE